MKLKSIIFSGLLFSIASTFSSCEDMLSEKPAGFINPQQFYNNLQQVQAGTNGCYIPLTSIYTSGMMVVTEALTDIVYLNNSQDDTRFDVSPSSPGHGRNLWTQNYRGIMFCNSTIAGIERFIAKSPKDSVEAKSYIGEAVFLRALYYYNLTSIFNDVPFYTDDICNLETMNRIAGLGRMSAVDTRDFLIENLKEYAPYLPQKISSSVPENRISGPAAYTLLAKICLWNAYRDGNHYTEYYKTAMDALKKVRDIYGANFTEDIYKLEDTWLRNKNTKESIFEIQYTWSETGLKKTTNIACMMTPPRTGNSNSPIYDGLEVKELGSKATINNSMRPTLYYMELFGPADANDRRKGMILASTYGSNWFSRPQRGKPWMGPKFWCPGMDNVSDSNNQKIFRYADVLLMIAECGIYTGETQLAMSCLKAIKDRANCYSKVGINSWPGDAEFLQEVKDERARELMGEFQRRFDLVRWGEYYEAITTRTFADQIGVRIPGGDLIRGVEGVVPETINNFKKCHIFYPIPDNEVVRTGGALDNKTYNEEGL